VQIEHSRTPNAVWKLKSSGFLSKSQELQVKALRPITSGERITMDYAPSKLESQVPFYPCPPLGTEFKSTAMQSRSI
jgi:SET domain-containing protein